MHLLSRSRGLARWEPVLFVLLIAIQLAPIWSVRYLPTTDGAAHVASADVMRRYHDASLPVFREYYYISSRPVPNLAGHLLLEALLAFASPVVAEKLLVSLIVAALPIAMRYAVQSIRPRAVALAYLAFPMTYSFLLGQGFYNFCLSLAVLLLVVGYWIRRRERINAWRGLALMAMLLALYMCHLFALVLACGILGLLAAWQAWLARGAPGQKAVRTLIITIVAMLPAGIMAAIFRPVTTGFEDTPGAWSPREDIVSLLQFSTMISYRKSEGILGGAIAGVIFALALWAGYVRVGKRHEGTKARRHARSVSGPLGIIALGLLGSYFVAHDGNAIHFYVPPRTMLCFFLVTALWLAAQPITRRIRALVIPLSAALGLAMTASHAMKYREFAPQIREFVSAGERMRPNSTFLPLIYAPYGRNAVGRPSSTDVAPFYMISGYIAVQRQVVDLRNYEAKTDHFPVRFREALNPYKWLAVGQGLDQIPPKIDLAGYARRGGRVDYVLLWGMTPEQRQLPGTIDLVKQLEADYERVNLPGAKWTEMWERKS